MEDLGIAQTSATRSQEMSQHFKVLRAVCTVVEFIVTVSLALRKRTLSIFGWPNVNHLPLVLHWSNTCRGAFHIVTAATAFAVRSNDLQIHMPIHLNLLIYLLGLLLFFLSSSIDAQQLTISYSLRLVQWLKFLCAWVSLESLRNNVCGVILDGYSSLVRAWNFLHMCISTHLTFSPFYLL